MPRNDTVEITPGLSERNGGPVSSNGSVLGRLRRSLVESRTQPFTARDALPGRRELLWASLLLTALTAAVYAQHVARGGWVYDDWSIIGYMKLEANQSFPAVLFEFPNYRLGAAFVYGVLYSIAGTGQAAYLVAGVVITAVECILFYTVLRLVRLQPIHAGCAAALLAVVPFVDATRLWIAAFPSTVAMCLYFGGAVAALIGLRAASQRARVGWHAGALALYAWAALTYELVVPIVCATAFLYLAVAGWRMALRRWPADLVVSGVSLLIVNSRLNDKPPFRTRDVSVDHFREHGELIWKSASVVFRFSLPFDKLIFGPVGLAIALACALGIGRAIERGALAGRAARGWLLVGATGFCFALLGYSVLLPTDDYYVPHWTGIGDRFSVVAAPGYAVLVVALAWLAALGATALLRRPRFAAPIALVAIAITGIGLARQELRNQDAWAKSWTQSQEVVADIRAAIGPTIPKGSSIVTFRHPQMVLPADVPVFTVSWDLDGAMKMAYDDPTLLARPYWGNTTCTATSLAWPPWGVPPFVFPSSAQVSVPYGQLWFVDAEHRRAVQIRNRRACERVRTAFLKA